MKVRVRHLKIGDKYKYYAHQKQYHCEVTGFVPINDGVTFYVEYSVNGQKHKQYSLDFEVYVELNFRKNVMTVAEAIAILSTMNQDAILVNTPSDINGGFAPIFAECFVSDNMEYYDSGNIRVFGDSWEVEYHREDYPNDNILPAVRVN